MLARPAAILVSLVALAALPAISAAAPSRAWHARYIAAPDGANIRLTTIANDGAAAGLKVLTDGTPHALYFNGRRLTDFSSRLGPVSSFTGLNDRHQAVGYFSSNPAARVTNLFGSNPDPSIMPHAFFMSGKTIKRLTVPSVAFGVNNAGWVAGTYRTTDGLLHAFLWLPLSKRRPNFADLGAGDARALADPSRPRRLPNRRHPRAALSLRGTVTIVGGNTVWIVNVLTGATRRRAFDQSVFLQSVSDKGVAVGGEDHPDASFSPMLFNIPRGSLMTLPLPPGTPNGFAAGVSLSGGLAAGSVSNSTGTLAQLWMLGSHATVNVNDLPGVDPPAGAAITNTPAVSDTGLLAGFATTPTGQQEGVVVAPAPPTKVPRLIDAFDDYLNRQGFGGSGEPSRHFRAKVRESLDDWKHNHTKLSCIAVKDAAQDLLTIAQANFEEQFNNYYDYGVDRHRANELAAPARGIDIRQALAEYGEELGCKEMKQALGLSA